MADQHLVKADGAGTLLRQFKEIGTDPVTSLPVYAEVIALEAGSIGGGGGGGLTDAQLRATAVPVSGTFWQATQPVSGSIDVTPAAPAANDYLPVRLTDGAAFYEAGGGAGGGGTEYVDNAATPLNPEGPTLLWKTDDDLWATTGTLSPLPVSVESSAGVFQVADNSGSLTVDGVFWPATQPISAASLPLPTGAATEAIVQAVRDRLPAALVGGRFSVDVGNTPTIANTGFNVNNWPAVQPVSDNGGSLTVDGTFWQVTQPVSSTQLPAALAAGGGIKVEGVAGGVAQPVSGTFWQATQPVSGTFWQATQPVSGTVAVTDQSTGAAKTQVTSAAGTAAVIQSDADSINATQASLAVQAKAYEYSGTAWERARSAADLVVTTISAANTTVTLTLPAPAAGLRHYVTGIQIRNINPTAAAIAASAVTLSYTTTNLGGPIWTAGNLLAAGTEKNIADIQFSKPLKATATATASTIVAPAIGAGGLVRMTAYYYTAP